MKCMRCGEHAAGAFCDVHRQPSFDEQANIDPYADTLDLITEIEPDQLMWSDAE